MNSAIVRLCGKAAGFCKAAVTVLLLAGGVQAQTEFPFFDDMEDIETSGENWSLPEESRWEIVTTSAHSGSQAWGITPVNAWDYVILAAPIDLERELNPRLQLWFRTLNGQTGVTVDGSVDGGETWTRWYQEVINQESWTPRQLDIRGAREPQVLIRIGANAGTVGATLMFDDIVIENAPIPGVLRLTDPENNAFFAEWDESTADDFARYVLVIDTNRNGIDDRSAAGFVSGRRERRRFEFTDPSITEIDLTDIVFTNTTYHARIWEQDTRQLWNQGSDPASIATTFELVTEVAPFIQDFEADNFQWAGDYPWMDTDAAQDEPGHSPIYAMEDSPADISPNYAPDADRRLIIKTDFSQVARPVLRFNHRYDFQSRFDAGWVYISEDGVNWNSFLYYTGIQGEWQTVERYIGSWSRRSPVWLMFQVKADGNIQGNGWHLDDVEVFDLPEGTAAYPFLDDVEDEAKSQEYWLGSYWNTVTTEAYSGSRAWTVTPGSGVSSLMHLTKTIDISRAENPHLSMWLRTIGGSVTYQVHISTDAGVTRTRLSDATLNNASWSRIQINLNSFRSKEVMIAINAIERTIGATLMLDNVLLDDAPTPGTISLVDPENNALRIVWSESTADDFARYVVILDTDSRGLSDHDTGGFTDRNRRERRRFEITEKGDTEIYLDDIVFPNTTYHARIWEQGTQDFWNQGSATTSETTTFELITEVAPFLQDFEGDDFQWAGDYPWMVTDAARDEEGHSASRALEDSPIEINGNYAANTNRWLVVRTDLSRLARPAIRFNHRYNLQGDVDFARVYWNATGDDPWNEMMRFTGNEGGWTTVQIDIGGLSRRNPIYFLFQVESNGDTQSDGWNIDDVEIFDLDRVVSFPYADDMENTERTERDWIGEGWQLVTTEAHSGTQARSLVMSASNNLWRITSLVPVIDLTGVGNPTLKFWVRTFGGRVSYWMMASSDGGVTYSKLFNDITENTEGVWKELTVNLGGFISPNTTLRFVAKTSNPGATIQFDDVSIDLPETVSGDASGDGQVTALDASVIMQYVVGLRRLAQSAIRAADVSGNGRVTPFDATLVLRFVAELLEVFPVDEEEVAKPIISAGRLHWAQVQPGIAANTLSLPLVLDGAKNVNAVEINLSFDPLQLGVEGIHLDLPSGWQAAHRIEEGELHLALAGTVPLAAGQLGRLELKLLQADALTQIGGSAFINENAASQLTPITLKALPVNFALGQNFPNPFNPSTQIAYHIPTAGTVKIAVYNLVGQKVRTLVNSVQGAGRHVIEWDGRNEAGDAVETGMYLYRMQSDGFVQTRKMLLLE